MRKICAIYFLVNNPSKTGCTVERVDCSPFTQQTWRKAKLMMASQTGEMNSIQIFTISVKQSYAFPTRISRFRVKMTSTTPTFDFKFRDQSFKEDLWGCARNLKLTDFVFLVEFTSFPAHRSLLAARSPVFFLLCSTMDWTKPELAKSRSTMPIPRRSLFSCSSSMSAKEENEEEVVISDGLTP